MKEKTDEYLLALWWVFRMMLDVYAAIKDMPKAIAKPMMSPD